LLSAAAGALVAMPLTSRLVGSFGSARLTQVTTVLLCAAVILPPLATSAPALALLLFVYGAAAGSMDVAMNTQAVTVEAASGRRVMVGFHALFSFGGMIGSILGSVATRYAIGPTLNLAIVGAIMAAVGATASRNLIPDQSGDAPAAQSARELLLPLLGLGVVAFCILVGEGAMADWSAVYVNQLAGMALAPLGYAVFSLAMAMGRLAGDWFHEHAGPVFTVRWGSALATVGLVAALSIGTFAATMIGFACVGFGFSAIFPIVCSVAGSRAGNRPQAGIAAVSMTGYLGFLAGPPMIGFLAQVSSLRVALGLVAILSAVTAGLAGIVRPPNGTELTASDQPVVRT
jgi:MFS family permease